MLVATMVPALPCHPIWVGGLRKRSWAPIKGVTGFDPVPFAPQPLYGGNPWFLQVVEMWMKAKDRIEGVQAVRRRS